jgi:Prophage tail length tape measure protein
MAAGIGDLVATLGMNTRPFAAGISRSRGMLRRFSSGVSRTIGRIKGAFAGLAAMTGAAGMLTGVGLLYGAKKAVDAATVQEQAEKKLQAVLIATGGAAGFTADELAAYAAQLQKVTNYGDEATISAMGIMASFKEIKGTQFKQATSLAQDLSSLLKTDLKSSVVMIGKALNDPAVGLTAMSRAGVTFTNQQKDQIRAMQKSGDMLGAQKMILAELESQFGGTAKGMVDPLKQAGNAWGDVMEQIGSVIKPAFVAIANGFMAAIKWVSQFKNDFIAIGRAIWAYWSAQWALIAGIVGTVFDFLGMSAGNFGDTVHSVLQAITTYFETMAFATRNIWNLMKLGIVSVVLYFLEVFPKMEGPITAVAKFFVGTWAGIEAFFGTIIDNMIGGFKELMNVGKAVMSAMAAGLAQIAMGNIGGAGKAMADEFMLAFSEQQDVKAPNAFKAFTDARKAAADGFQNKMDNAGGMTGWLKQRKQDIQAAIAADEQGRTEIDKTHEVAGGPAMPALAGAGAGGAGTAEKAKGPSVMQRGSAEAWKKIVTSMNGGSGKDKLAERGVNAQERTANGVEQLADNQPEEVGIA